MANDSYWYTWRDGDWSRPITYHDSPWWSGDSDADLLNFYPGEGDTVIIRHDVTVDIDLTIGQSLQEAIWAPLAISTTGGGTVTQLATGTYTLAATVTSIMGETQVANTVSAPFVLTQGVSKPRVTFAQAPPTGCSYKIYLDNPENPGDRKLYCSDIIAGPESTSCDLVSPRWLAHMNNEGAAMGGTGEWTDSQRPLPSGQTSAVTITAEGSLAVVGGKELTLRGDVVIESPSGSTKPYITIGSGATMRSDSSAAAVPQRANYVLWFHGGGDVKFLGVSADGAG